jgi:hypothetical protein
VFALFLKGSSNGGNACKVVPELTGFEDVRVYGGVDTVPRSLEAESATTPLLRY